MLRIINFKVTIVQFTHVPFVPKVPYVSKQSPILTNPDEVNNNSSTYTVRQCDLMMTLAAINVLTALCT